VAERQVRANSEAPGENWAAVSSALYDGNRGLPAGGSLAKLLDRHRRGGKGHA
jgi:hypothetical protein